MKFDSISRIILVAAVASGFALTAQADGTHRHHRHHKHARDGQHQAQTRDSKGATRMLDGQKPPPPPPDKKDGHKRRHKKKPAPAPKPVPPTGG